MDRVLDRILTHDLDLSAIATELDGVTSADVLQALQEALAGPSPDRDAACAVVDAVALRPDGVATILAEARRLPPDGTARILLLAVASEHPGVELSPAEHDEALLGPLRLLARDASTSALAATGLAEKWAALDPPKRDALLAWFEAAAEGTADALLLAACVFDEEVEPSRIGRLLRLIASSGHPDSHRVLERIAAATDRDRSTAARRTLLTMGSVLDPEVAGRASAEDAVEAGSSVAMLTGLDGFGRFETLLAVPRFAALWELVVLRVEIDDGRAVSASYTSVADRADLGDFASAARAAGVLVSQVGPGEASEIVLRAAARLPEMREGRDEAIAAAVRVASSMTRRSLLPPPTGDSDEGLDRHVAFARVGLALGADGRRAVLDELESILPRAGGHEAKLESLVLDLAGRLSARFDDVALRERVAARIRHQAVVLRALGDHETAGRAAFAARRALTTPVAQTALGPRMIANAILAELRRDAEEPDETALRQALRDRYFPGPGPGSLSDLEALDVLQVLAEVVGELGLELPDEAVSAVRVVTEEVHEAVRASGPYRRLPMLGDRAPVLANRTLTEIAERVLGRTLPQLPAAAAVEAAREIAAFLGEVCLSRCPQRCFDDPSPDPDALFSSDEHPATLSRHESFPVAKT